MQQWLRDDGVSTYDISTFEADEAVRTWYGLTASEFEPSFVGEAIEGTWTEAATAAFSSAGTPNLAVPSTLTDNTLIQFLNTSSLDYKPFTTTIGTLTENNVTTAEGIQNLFAMPTAPNTVTAVSGYEDGTRFIIGEAAENAYGAGGGLQVFGESQALAVGEEMSIGDFLEMLALALLDRQRHTAIHR